MDLVTEVADIWNPRFRVFGYGDACRQEGPPIQRRKFGNRQLGDVDIIPCDHHFLAGSLVHHNRIYGIVQAVNKFFMDVIIGGFKSSESFGPVSENTPYRRKAFADGIVENNDRTIVHVTFF